MADRREYWKQYYYKNREKYRERAKLRRKPSREATVREYKSSPEHRERERERMRRYAKVIQELTGMTAYSVKIVREGCRKDALRKGVNALEEYKRCGVLTPREKRYIEQYGVE